VQSTPIPAQHPQPHTHCRVFTHKVSRAPASAPGWLSTALRAAPQHPLWHWDPVTLLAAPLSLCSCLQTREQESMALFLQENPSPQRFAANGGAAQGLGRTGKDQWSV